MKKSLVWIAKQIIRTAFIVWLCYTFSQPPGHALDFIPRWLSIGLALGLFWPVYWKLIKDLYGSVADDIAGRVEKRISAELHAFHVQYQMDTKPPSTLDLIEMGVPNASDEAHRLLARYGGRPLTVYLYDILREMTSRRPS
jgi:hypothetical protein